MEQQRELQQERYRYEPRDPVVRKQYQERYENRSEQRATDRQNRQGGPEERGYRQQDIQRPAPRQQDGPGGAPRSQSPQRGGENAPRFGPGSPDAGNARDRNERPQGKDAAREHKHNQEKDWDRHRNN